MANWFIGLPVAAEQLPGDLFDRLPAGLQRLAPADLHITVAFLGRVGERVARDAWEAARVETEPIVARLGQPAALGHHRRPTAFGLDLGEGTEAVAALIERWQNPLREIAGAGRDERPARPHITVARVPRRGGEAIRRRARRWVETYEPPATRLDLDTLALYTWSADRRAGRFQIVARADLPCA